MLVKDLIAKIEKYPDFEINVHIEEPDNKVIFWPSYKTHKIIGLGDIGHSSKVLILDTEERRRD